MEILNIPVSRINNENLNQEHLQFIESVNLCPLCGSELEFKHNTNFQNRQVKEEAFCKACGIRTKAQDFLLQ